MRAYTGKELRIDIASESGRVIKLKRYNGDGSDAGDMSVMYAAELRSVEGDDFEAVVGVSYASDGGVVLDFPEMGLGRHVLVIDMSREDGERERWLTGYVTYLEPRATERGVEAEPTPERVIAVVEGEEVRQFSWLPTSAGEIAAERAEASEEAIRDMVSGFEVNLDEAIKEATITAELAATNAENAAVRAEGAAGEILGKLEAAQAFIESFNKALFESLRVIDNYLYVGGVNTGHYLKGENGITPHIGTDGYWYEGEKKLGDRPAFGADGITPHITADGYWAFGDWKSEVRAAGRDGIDGSAVRMLIVDSYADIPQGGEMCNGGVRYCVPVSGERMLSKSSVLFGESENQGNYSGDLVWAARRTWNADGGVLYELGLQSASASNGEPSSELLYAHIYYRENDVWTYAGRSLEAVAQVASAKSFWRFDGLSLPMGRDVRVLLSQEGERVLAERAPEVIRVKVVATNDGSTCAGGAYAAVAEWRYLASARDFYDVYAWMEDALGNGAWHLMNRSYDFATSEVFGVVKTATDLVVNGGAPVGKNNKHQLTVPVAEASVPGVVLPSSASTENGGGLTHVGTDRKLYVGRANPSVAGVGKTSYTQVAENTGSVGMTEDGKFAVPRAAAFQWGVSRVGTSVPQSNGMPWIIPVGMADDGVRNEYGSDITGQLMNNTLVGGALRTGTKEMWLNWEPQGIDAGVLPSSSNAVGIMTSLSFRQSAELGLELNPATDALLGGVMLDAETVSSNNTLVPTSAAVRVYLETYYYDKEEVYNKTELTRKNGVIEQVLKNIIPLYSGPELEPYATKDWAYENLARKFVEDRVNENKMSIQGLKNRVDYAESELYNCVKKGNSGISELAVWTEAEWSKLTVIDENKLHIVLE